MTTALDDVKHLTKDELEAGFETICQAPRDHGALEMIVRRPDGRFLGASDPRSDGAAVGA